LLCYGTYCLTNKKAIRTIVRMKLIADTNTFLAVTLYEPERDEIIRLSSGYELVAPDVLPFEIGNALSAMLKRGRLAPDELLSAWDAVKQIPVDLRSIDIRSALKIAVQFNIYAYDAYFLACAFSLHSPLITLDRRMMQVAESLDIHTMEVKI
jgi:predicted nucleic acid-binding protein